MNKIAIIGLWLFPVAVFAQGGSSVMLKGDAASTVSSPAILSRSLVRGCTTDRQKVAAIFHWITDNISYSKRSLRSSGTQASEFSVALQEEAMLPSLTERVAAKVLADRQGVCEGYARLFQSLCDHAGIPAVIITGYARTENSRELRRFRSNHSWNAVFVDSAWHLMDLTWASGFMAWPSGDFVKAFDTRYYFASPAVFIGDHYPDDWRWSLLHEPPVISEFSSSAFRQRSFLKYGITAFLPAKGVIDVQVGDTIRLQLHTTRPALDRKIAPDSLWEKSNLTESAVFAYVQPLPATADSAIVRYEYEVKSPYTQWLYVMYNEDAILRYRVRMHPNNSTVIAADQH